MAKYDVVYSCGHEGVVHIFGSSRDREWKLAREEEKLCPECWKQKLAQDRAKVNAEAAEANAAAGLPQLEGTEAQVAWAESIRLKAVKIFEELFDDLEPSHADYPELRKGYESIRKRTDTAWWVDHRHDLDNSYRIERFLREEARKARVEESAPPAEIVEQAKADATVYPEKRVTDLVAEIKINEKEISVYLPERNEKFREVVKALDYEWRDGRWRRSIKVTAGPAADRAAELGNRLCSAGFPIRIYDAEIRQRAISGDYKPEQRKWILVCTEKSGHPGWFAIHWDRREGDYYDAARRLAGAKWSRPYVIVPPENCEEVLDFAKMYGFEVSAAARQASDAAEELKRKTLIPKVGTPDESDKVVPIGKPPVLEVPDEVEIDDEFRDEN